MEKVRNESDLFSWERKLVCCSEVCVCVYSESECTCGAIKYVCVRGSVCVCDREGESE